MKETNRYYTKTARKEIMQKRKSLPGSRPDRGKKSEWGAIDMTLSQPNWNTRPQPLEENFPKRPLSTLITQLNFQHYQASCWQNRRNTCNTNGPSCPRLPIETIISKNKHYWNSLIREKEGPGLEEKGGNEAQDESRNGPDWNDCSSPENGWKKKQFQTLNILTAGGQETPDPVGHGWR